MRTLGLMITGAALALTTSVPVVAVVPKGASTVVSVILRRCPADNTKVVVPYESAALLGAAQVLRGVLAQVPDGVSST